LISFIGFVSDPERPAQIGVARAGCRTRPEGPLESLRDRRRWPNFGRRGVFFEPAAVAGGTIQRPRGVDDNLATAH
jgi:hypothetical protein